MTAAHDPGFAEELEQTAEAATHAIEALRISDAPVEVLRAVREHFAAAADMLRAHARPGPYAQSVTRLEQAEFFSTPLPVPHRVMPWSPIIGRFNPVSPRFEFYAREGRLEGRGEFPVRFVGAPQTAHGGLVAAVLDEMMGLVNFLHGEGAFTGTMTVRYHRPTPIQRELALGAEMTGAEGRKISSRAEIRCDGELTASAEGLFIRPRSDEVKT